MERMELIDIVSNIDSFDDDSIIFVPHNSKPVETTKGYVLKIKIIDLPTDIKTPDGMIYFLEVKLVKDILRVWKDWRNGKEPSTQEKFEAVLYYSENDAYKPIQPSPEHNPVEGVQP